MKRFIALYFLFLSGLFVLFYAPTSQISQTINNIQSHLTLVALDFFLEPKQLKGIDIWINSYYKIIINKACNGIVPILFLFASILAYPSTLVHKIFWMFLGYIAFFVVNILRILFVVHITQAGKGHVDFYWSHDLVGNFLLMSTGLVIFIVFIKHSSKSI